MSLLGGTRRGWVGLAALVGVGCNDGTGTSASSAGQTGEITTGVGSTGTTATTGGSATTTVEPTGGSVSDSQTTDGPTTGGTTTTTGMTSTTGSSGQVSASETAGETTGGELCMGTLCGVPVVCCDPGEECVESKCLPECPSGVRCGPDLAICCAEGDVCSGDSCVTPGKDCNDSYDCDPGEYCEPTLDKCLPQPDPVTCEVVPEFDTLAVKLEWSYTTEQVISSPAIADLTGDGIPEVIVNTTKYMSNAFENGIVLALDGATGVELWRITPNNAMMRYGSHGRTTLAVGDVNGDKVPDVVYAGRPDGNGRSQIHAVDHTGKWIWTARNPDNSTVAMAISNGAATLANFDDDDMAEVVWGGSLIDHDGRLVWSTGVNAGHLGSPANYPGGISAVADLDGDAKPEIITGKQAWNVAWTPGNPPTVMVTQRWINNDGNQSDGWPAVADLDGNGTPEIVLAANGQIRVIDGASGKAWCGIDPTGLACMNNDALRTKAYAVPGGGFGGPPTIADFDGDGRPEAAVAGASSYTVFDFNRMDEQIVKPMADPMPAAGAIYRRWSKTTQDQSSNCTGSSVFDFQGDGVAEVVYADECYMRVYSGLDGAVLLQIENSSSTIHEYPLVADVDGDGNSEILVVANAVGQCNIPNYKQRRGVYLYGDAGDGWVPTRRVWTQHTYHVTSANSIGNVPPLELDNWKVPGLNNYRQNDQGEGVFNASDLTVDLSIGLDMCTDKVVLIATVYNKGSLGVPAGIAVDFYEGTDATGVLLGTEMTGKALLPGGSTKAELVVPAPLQGMTKDFFVEVDDASEGDGQVLECDENNNGATATEVACLVPA